VLLVLWATGTMCRKTTLYRASRSPREERLLGLIARTSRCQIRMDPSSVMVQPGLCATSHT
jgi:hypothetical protein